MKIILLRHGETEWNALRRYQGRTDLPLSEAGRKALCPMGILPAAVYGSPLLRARQTAEAVFPGAEYRPVPGLEEMDFGLFEGHTYGELNGTPAYQAWLDSGGEAPIPGGESKAQFCARSCAAFRILAENALAAREELLVVVAHGGTQMAVLERYAVPRRGYYEWNAPTGGGFVLETDAERWRSGCTLTLTGTVCCTENEETT